MRVLEPNLQHVDGQGGDIWSAMALTPSSEAYHRCNDAIGGVISTVPWGWEGGALSSLAGVAGVMMRCNAPLCDAC